jgi:2-C-methyl-D-erythritol 2,4-cyclodiphosphate synthase
MIKIGIGQDSHRFDFTNKSKKTLILGGILFYNEPPLSANSDGDVILHSITNAISGVTGVNILGPVSDKMCLEDGITDSKEYLYEALKHLGDMKICHLSISIECLRPKIMPRLDELKESVAEILRINKKDVGITATSGEGLTGFGKGEGVQVISVVTAEV